VTIIGYEVLLEKREIISEYLSESLMERHKLRVLTVHGNVMLKCILKNSLLWCEECWNGGIRSRTVSCHHGKCRVT